ncbi:MAG: hypothetical protein KDD42_09335, partial [Bdellovibrionales bacterium]|nr:hypothetical protein [Bdellovibrionales bacterium]
QGADLLKLIAGDLSSMPYSPEAPIKCAAKNRDPKRSGKYFNPQPWTYSFEATAKELVAYARGSTGKISLQFPKLIP